MTAVARRRFLVAGVVQGVGFRPFVYRLAQACDLAGFVRNEIGYVAVEVEGRPDDLARFAQRLTGEPPPMARIDSVQVAELACTAEEGFRIGRSGPAGTAAAGMVAPRMAGAGLAGPGIVCPDIALCDDCRRELADPGDRRYRYPFITCTNCGPRFTIITSLPYDRPNTTMRAFTLCPACAAEYDDPGDRRHHAQPLACPDCGPVLHHEPGAPTGANGVDGVVARIQHDLARGLVVAVKGLGGYHLAVDATDDAAVERLRRRKARADKPFAVMVADLEAARHLAHLDDVAASALESPAHPIVLARATSPSPLSPLVAPGNPLVGLLLPYTPLHHLLLAPVPGEAVRPPAALVMTSGNLAGEPICHDDTDARARLAAVADSFCGHDRTIHAPCDDSVIRVAGGAILPIRRSRGYAPLPVALPNPVGPTLAVGGEIKVTFALATGSTAWMSQHLGDMANRETVAALEASVELFTGLYQVEPEVVVVDAHPGYQSGRWARRWAGEREVIEVQHHHAHLASLMAEHGLTGEDPVLGFVFDGTGYGCDGALWGGEVLVGGYARVERWGHLAEVPLPGGDATVRNPCRMALVHLQAAGVRWSDDLPSVRASDDVERRVIARQLAAAGGGPGRAGATRPRPARTSSIGRLFDAVASLLGVRHRITYEAQAAIELEILATEAIGEAPPLHFTVDPAGAIDATPVIRGIVASLRAGADPASLAREFHRAVVEVMVRCAVAIRRQRPLPTVGLTGGVFQNVLLASLAVEQLSAVGFEVLLHRVVPPNDGGLALGQVMVAAESRRERTCA